MKESELVAKNEKWHNKNYHINIKVPPLGAVFIKGKDILVDKHFISEDKKVFIGGKESREELHKNKKIEIKEL